MTPYIHPSAEERRLQAALDTTEDWQLWGTYLPERQWGTVREDYSAEGEPWTSFPYDMARWRRYRWGEDGLLGWTDRECRLCYATALWNGQDPHLKERLFGLSNADGNHGEDVKELYHYVDATPTGSYARALYRYPQKAFPYAELLERNRGRTEQDREFELLDTGAFEGERYFDVQIEYAKAAPEDTLIRLTITNRGPTAHNITVLPTLTFRNTWAWAAPDDEDAAVPELTDSGAEILANHHSLGRFHFALVGEDAPERLFTGNETDPRRMDADAQPGSGYYKDAFDRMVVHGERDAVDPARRGTRAAFLINRSCPPGDAVVLRLRLVRDDALPLDVSGFDTCMARRRTEADEFYDRRLARDMPPAERAVAREALAGLLWSKQFYYFAVSAWLKGDPGQPPPPPERWNGRNAGWLHLHGKDVLSMPDKWEYPWFAAWDLAFHMLPMAQVDPAYAKGQLLLMLREWYLHPNGALPAYEYGFDQVNPPVHAWAVLHVYRIEQRNTGKGDLDFLERAFQKLLLNFTWWVNRNDAAGKNLFGGGFLGLDNIGLFDRNSLPDGATLNQADGTAWMGLYCSTMLMLAIELAKHRPVYEDIASKFFEHYIAVVDAINSFGGNGLWDEEAGFFFDQLVIGDDPAIVLKAHSMVGLVPLFAIAIQPQETLDKLPEYMARVTRSLKINPGLAAYTGRAAESSSLAGAGFLGLVPKDRLLRILRRVLDESQFLSPHGIRSVSQLHQREPLACEHAGRAFTIDYEPGESTNGLFGGNSNWRGPVWFPVNMLLINALHRYDAVYGSDITVECPTGSGVMMTLAEVANEIARRLVALFLPGTDGHRPCHGGEARYAADGPWHDMLLFHEYFDGETGRGLGASHQTGWTAMVATCIDHVRRGVTKADIA